MVQAMFNNLSVPNPKMDYLQFELGNYVNELPENTTECMFWGMGSDELLEQMNKVLAIFLRILIYMFKHISHILLINQVV